MISKNDPSGTRHVVYNNVWISWTVFTKWRNESGETIEQPSRGVPHNKLDGLSFVELFGVTDIKLSGTYLDDADVRPLCAVRRIRHYSPSSVDARTIMRSYTHPDLKRFLIDCGVPQVFAEYMIGCARAMGEPLLWKLMQSTFISYGAPDEAFARQLYDALKAHGAVVFFFPETAFVGERISNEVFRQLQRHDRVLLVCSRNSLRRPGVVNEIQQTLDREEPFFST
jgi:hypothetical protein